MQPAVLIEQGEDLRSLQCWQPYCPSRHVRSIDGVDDRRDQEVKAA